MTDSMAFLGIAVAVLFAESGRVTLMQRKTVHYGILERTAGGDAFGAATHQRDRCSHSDNGRVLSYGIPVFRWREYAGEDA